MKHDVVFDEDADEIIVHRKGKQKALVFRRGFHSGAHGWFWVGTKYVYRLFFDFHSGCWIGQHAPVGGGWVTWEKELGAWFFDTVKGRWFWT